VSSVKHIIFDCDGVLVDTEYVAAIHMTRALNELGVNITVDYYLQNFSGSTFSSIINKYFNKSETQFETSKIISEVEDKVAAEVKLIAGVRVLLENIEQAKSVVSNSSLKTVEDALSATGIRAHFGSIYSSEFVNKPKPAADVYLFALKSLGLKASDVLVIEDSISGVKATLSAGLTVIGFTGGSHILPGHQQKLLDLGVLKVCGSMIDLENYLSNKLSQA